jgi:hypothetical protein
MIDVDSLTVREVKSLCALVEGKRPKLVKSHSFEVGHAYFIRTVTLYYTGRIKAVTASDLVLEDAAWIADCGRYSVALATGALNEIEPIPGTVIVGRGAIVDAVPWTHALPKTVK